MPENNHEEWKELRARVDSIANAVFLIGGGALSLSITAMLDMKGKSNLRPDVAEIAQNAWMYLVASVITMLLLKALAVLQAYLLHEHTEYHDRVYKRYNIAAWLIGICAIAAFAWGLILMVRAASLALLA